MSTLELVHGRQADQRPRALLPFEYDFIGAIDSVDAYCRDRGEIGGLDTGFPEMTEKLEGLQPGLILVAGQANSGKTAFMVQLALQVAQRNRDAYCIYHSLDDNMREIIPRVVACLARIPINAVKFPVRYETRGETAILQRRTNGLNQLRNLVNNFGIRDALYDGSGTDIETVEKSVKEIKMHTDKKVVLFIDNFHDLSSRQLGLGESDNSRYDFLANELSRMATQYDIPIVCTAEFRKLNGYRRPLVDDVRETTKIGYEAKAVLLCYNEVGLKGETANLYHDRSDVSGKQPILEVHYGKNKLSSFKGRLFYNFYPEFSSLEEVPSDGMRILSGRLNG